MNVHATLKSCFFQLHAMLQASHLERRQRTKDKPIILEHVELITSTSCQGLATKERLHATTQLTDAATVGCSTYLHVSTLTYIFRRLQWLVYSHASHLL